MPNRILRDGILTSESVAGLGWAAEVFYRRLMSVADDHGRFHGIPKLIRAACYPLQIDKVSDADIGKWLTECVTAALVSVYPASDGKRYIQIVKFGQQVRSKSKFPEPCDGNDGHSLSIDSNRKQVPADAHLDVVGDVVEGGDVSRKRAKRSQKTSLPADFGVSERVRVWAAEKGFTRLDEYLEFFRSKAVARGYTYVDWDEGFMGCIREDWPEFRKGGTHSAGMNSPDYMAGAL